MKQLFKEALGLGCHVFRIGRARARVAPGRFVILMFHRVVDANVMCASANRPLMVKDTVFSRLAETLATECLCLPLEEAMLRAKTQEYSPKPVVAVTFDDGYADCYRTVFPIVKHHGVPITIYLTTGHLDDPGRFFWWDAVEAYFANPANPRAFSDAGLPGAFLDTLHGLADFPCVQDVESFIRGPIRRLDKAGRKAFLDMIGKAPVPPPPVLSWNEAREMAGSGLVSFGAHTVTHPFLDELTQAEATNEVLISKKRIEDETGQPVTSFAYPSGRVPPFHREMLAQAGLGLAVTTRPGTNGHDSDPLLLRRMDARLGIIGNDFSPAYFLALCSGCLAWLN